MFPSLLFARALWFFVCVNVCFSKENERWRHEPRVFYIFTWFSVAKECDATCRILLFADKWTGKGFTWKLLWVMGFFIMFHCFAGRPTADAGAILLAKILRLVLWVNCRMQIIRWTFPKENGYFIMSTGCSAAESNEQMTINNAHHIPICNHVQIMLVTEKFADEFETTEMVEKNTKSWAIGFCGDF